MNRLMIAMTIAVLAAPPAGAAFITIDNFSNPNPSTFFRINPPGSNVNPVLELTRIIEISRAYESAARIVKNGDDLRQRTIERLARA